MHKVSGVSIIMPTFNEGGHIQDLLHEISKALIGAGISNFELLVVDDDSSDLTWKKASETGISQVRVIRRMENHGLTASIWDGVLAAQYEVLVWLDCDFSHPPEKIPQLLYMVEQGYDIAVNSRYAIGGGEDRVGKGGPLQLFLSKFLNWGIRFILKPSFSDYTSGFIAVKRAIVIEMGLRGDYGEYFVDFIYRILRSEKYSVCELPYKALPRRSGESKTGTNLLQYLRRGNKYIWMVIKLKLTT